MKLRPLGKTGINVSEIGYGAWGIGGELWQGSDDKESLRALQQAADLGLNFIDTALAYGQGHSERLIATFKKKRESGLTIATKIPPKNRVWPARQGTKLRDAFPYDYILECTEKSRKNLDMDTIDLQQFHVWTDEWADHQEWKDAILTLKVKKKIRFFGISINDHQPANALGAAATGMVDTFQVIYNIFDQSPEERLFPVCLEKGIGVIVRVPFDEGSLTGKITTETEFPEKDFRHKYFRGDRKKQVVERIAKLEKLLGQESTSVAELALRFCLHHLAVSTVIPGMRTEAHARQNCAVSDGRALSPALLGELKNHKWERNFYE
jgi:aryl-alcohol dehydrogenase-like predicted oxidoreductase